MEQMSVSEAKAALKLLWKEANEQAAANYTWYRDDDAYLHIDFADGKHFRIPHFPFRIYQVELQKKLFQEGYKRALLERPRRSGKEYESWNLLISSAITDPGLYLMVYPTNVRARAVLWEGAITLPDGRSVPFLSMIPARLMSKKNDQEMRINLVNGSVIWVMGSDVDPNKLRGTNPRGIVYAEFAFQDPHVCHIMFPVLRQNGGWMIGQSTFDGMNHFWKMMEHNKLDPKWYCRIDSVTNLVDENGNRYITDEMIEEDRRAGMPEYLIQQEYYGTVEINQETKYFANALNNLYQSDRVVKDLFLPNKNVYAAYDLGRKDQTAVILFQVKRVKEYLAPVLIAYTENNNKDLTYYVNWCRSVCARLNLSLRRHFIPHDGENRDGMLKNYVDYGRDLGEEFVSVARPQHKGHAIEAMRRMLYLAEFNEDGTRRLLECLSNYSKEYDNKSGTWKPNPVHDWSSHGVDSFQTMTLALEAKLINDRPAEIVYYYQ